MWCICVILLVCFGESFFLGLRYYVFLSSFCWWSILCMFVIMLWKLLFGLNMV